MPSRSRPIDYAAASPEHLRSLIDSPPGDRTTRAWYHIRDRARLEMARRGLPVPGPARAPAAAGPRDHHGQKITAPRNGLPEPIPYTYQGTGHDMTGDCLCGTDCPWAAPPGQRPRKASITRAERERLQREELYDDSPRRQAERRARLADAS